MKNNKKNLYLSLIILIESLFLILLCFNYLSNNNVKVFKSDDNSYEITFRKNTDTSIFVSINDKGFNSINFRDNSQNQGLITFGKEYDGYFSLYNAALNYAIDNRSSQKENFKFQRLECFEDSSYCYDISYDDELKIKMIPLPTIDNSD